MPIHAEHAHIGIFTSRTLLPRDKRSEVHVTASVRAVSNKHSFIHLRPSNFASTAARVRVRVSLRRVRYFTVRTCRRSGRPQTRVTDFERKQREIRGGQVMELQNKRLNCFFSNVFFFFFNY